MIEGILAAREAGFDPVKINAIALKGVTDHDDATAKEGKRAEERFLKSYPFHPDLTEVLYAKWTQLQGFQRTRGVLRTFALALRAQPALGPHFERQVQLTERDITRGR